MSLSIIIPLYNKQAFIAEALERLVVQLADGDEIIVVNDCSTDDGVAVVTERAFHGVRLMRTPFNDGPASARNLGASSATGTHFLFFDADDIPQPDLLPVLRGAIAATPSEAVWAYDLAFEAHGEEAGSIVDATSAAVRTTLLPRDAFVESSLVGKPPCTASSTCVRADVFHAAGGFQQGLRYCEDPELWARLSAQYPIVWIERTLATYRDVPASLSYGLRAKPGAVQPYVDTLLRLAQSGGEAYRRAASSMIVRNAVFSIALGGSRRELLGYISRLLRAGALQPMRAVGLSMLAVMPRPLVRAPLALRSALGQRRALARSKPPTPSAPTTVADAFSVRTPVPPTPPTRPTHVAPHVGDASASNSSAVFYFLLFGCLQTLISYYVFQRTDDHAYFLDIANRGIDAVEIYDIPLVDAKAKAVAWVYYALATPSRWLGGGDLVHLLWLRVLTLLGFVWAHRWVCRVVEPQDHKRLVARSQANFMVLCLLYPAQLAWTASLLRDGVSCTMLFLALLAWSHRRWLLAAAAIAAGLALRPEFALLLVLLAIVLPRWRSIGRLRNRALALAIVCLAISIATFNIRTRSSAFAIVAFGDEGAAYPSIQSMFDLKGYALVLLQSMLDPMSIGAPGAGGAFFWAEVMFFTLLSVGAMRRLNRAPPRAAALLIVVFVVMWLFAYFEIFVSGFSRHRIGPMIILIAIMAVLRASRRQALVDTAIETSHKVEASAAASTRVAG